MRTLSAVVLLSLVFSAGAGEHPFLIIKKAEYPALVSKASSAPWSQMLTQAKNTYASTTYVDSDAVNKRGLQIRDLMGSSALLYIVDPVNKAKYRSTIVAMLNKWPALFTQMSNEWPTSPNRWHQTVPPSSGFFQSVIALDVIHDDLSSTDLAKYEGYLNNVAEWYWTADRGWGAATYGVRAVWSVYKGDTTRQSTALSQYRNQIFGWLTADGIFKEGPEYAHARYSGERTAKFGFMHVAEYTGVDAIYYRDQRLKNLYEWLYSGGFTHFNALVTFGDSGHGRKFNNFWPQAGVFAAGRFSATAAQYAAARAAQSGFRYPGDLLSYCIAMPAATPSAPKSNAWKDGCAVFTENTTSTDGLMGSLWSTTVGQSHCHKDANAIFLSGYGELLLLNSGYNSAGSGALNYSWTYINNTAESSNTLLMGGADHARKGGDKLQEWILNGSFDYASGLASSAFSGGANHKRSLCMIHPQDGKGGYFVSFDEADTNGTASSVTTAFHPASATVSAVSANQEYRWTIKRRKSTETYLSVFLATAPTGNITLKDGVLAGWGESFVGKYIKSAYSTVSNKKNIVTVFFPHDASHTKAAMTRLSGSGFSGARIDHGSGVVDVALESSSLSAISTSGINFQGMAAMSREAGGVNSFYFVRDGKSFSHSASTRGFSAAADVSIHMRGNKGKVVSPGTNVTFNFPQLTNVKINGVTAAKVSSGTNRVEVNVPVGTQNIELVTGTTPVNVPPAVSISSPANQAVFTAPANITINASATDSDGSVTKVEFYNGSTKLGEKTASPWTFTWSGVGAGTFSLTARAIDNSGAATASSAVSITVKSALAVKSFTLVNADTENDIGTLTNGATLNLGTLPTRNLNVRANTEPSSIGSVRFGLNGNTSYRVQNGAPYTLAGDSNGNYAAWTPPQGTNSLSATPYSAADATGTAGTALSISFSVIDPPVIVSGPSATGELISGAAISFTASASDPNGDALTYNWDFGDGTSATGNSPIKSYASPGTYNVSVTVSDGKGGSANKTLQVSIAAALNLKINFQPSGAPIPAGYLADTGAVFGNRGNGYSYGWNADNSTTTRDRNSPAAADQRFDTLQHMQKPENPNAVWEIALPNGTYRVRLVAGDPSYFNSIYRLNLEGIPALDFTPTSTARWTEASRSVSVVDGRLTLSKAAGAENNKICFVEINTATVTSRSVDDFMDFLPLNVLASDGQVNFTRGQSDKARLLLEIPMTDSTKLNNAQVGVDVGGAVALFALSNKGRARNAQGTLTAKFVSKRQVCQLAITLVKGSFSGTWTDGGLDGAKTSAELVLPIAITLNGERYGGAKTSRYSGRPGRSGKLK